MSSTIFAVVGTVNAGPEICSWEAKRVGKIILPVQHERARCGLVKLPHWKATTDHLKSRLSQDNLNFCKGSVTRWFKDARCLERSHQVSTTISPWGKVMRKNGITGYAKHAR